MANRPSIPDNHELPTKVGPWEYDSEATWNGHVWIAEGSPIEVMVFNHISMTRAIVRDSRIKGFDSEHKIESKELPDSVSSPDPEHAEATWWGIEQAVWWMERHDPDWQHPGVDETVFDAPPGFELDSYAVGNREIIIRYAQPGDALEMAGRRLDTEPSLSTRKYLMVKTWKGSGNSTIALSPWERPHDHELDEIVDPPEECGLGVAVKLAREWIAEQRGESMPANTAGQADITAFGD